MDSEWKDYLPFPRLVYFALNRWNEQVHSLQECNVYVTTGLRIRILNVLPGSGSGIIVPDPDPTLEKKKVGRFNIFPLKEEGGTYR